MHFIPPKTLVKHDFRGQCESCQVRVADKHRYGLASSQPDFVACHTCNRWLCADCRLAQTLGACILCPALVPLTNIAGPVLRIPSTCKSAEEVDALKRAADQACQRTDTGKYSTGQWAAGAQATSDRGRGPRVAKSWKGAADRTASPPEQEGSSESSGTYSYETTDDEKESQHLHL